MKYFDEYASQEENKRTWKKYMIEFHPDKNGGDHRKVNELNTEWNLMEQGYKQGLLPRKKQTAHREQPFNVFGGGVRPAANQVDNTIYDVKWKRKNYRGTENQIFSQIVADKGLLEGVEFTLAFQKKKAGEAGKRKEAEDLSAAMDFVSMLRDLLNK
jgi:curved DNA-binding protein CbpA